MENSNAPKHEEPHTPFEITISKTFHDYYMNFLATKKPEDPDTFDDFVTQCKINRIRYDFDR